MSHLRCWELISQVIFFVCLFVYEQSADSRHHGIKLHLDKLYVSELVIPHQLICKVAQVTPLPASSGSTSPILNRQRLGQPFFYLSPTTYHPWKVLKMWRCGPPPIEATHPSITTSSHKTFSLYLPLFFLNPLLDLNSWWHCRHRGGDSSLSASPWMIDGRC